MEAVTKFHDCGDCTSCCDGHLSGNVYGNKFGPRPCIFLVDKKCTIYETRPQSCKDYQCAWSQKLFDDLDKPSEANVLVSVEGKESQYLKCISINPVTKEITELLETWAAKHKTYIIWKNNV